MLRNPLRAHAERTTSKMLTRVGWEPPQTWPVPRPGREPLVFQTRLPAAEFVEPRNLRAAARRTPASVGGAAMPLQDAAQIEGVFLAVALCSKSTSREVLATMTAALSPQPLPFIDRAGVPQSRKARRKVKHIIGKVSVIERLDGDPAPLTVQYAVRTRFGTLTLTFRGESDRIAGPFGRRLFLDVVRASYLGRRPLVTP
jgi:hypothetical protein